MTSRHSSPLRAARAERRRREGRWPAFPARRRRTCATRDAARARDRPSGRRPGAPRSPATGDESRAARAWSSRLAPARPSHEPLKSTCLPSGPNRAVNTCPWVKVSRCTRGAPDLLPDGTTGADEQCGRDRHRDRDRTEQGQPPPGRGVPAVLDGARWASDRSEGLEMERQIVRRVEPPRGVLLQAALDHLAHPVRNTSGGSSGGRIVEDGLTADRRRPGKGARAGQHLVQHRAEAEEVGARVHPLAPDLLRRHVPRRAEDGARPGAARRGAAVVSSRPCDDGSSAASTALAIPKSSSFAWPSRVRKTFSGLRSRWAMPCSCAAASPAATWAAMSRTAPSGRRPPSQAPTQRLPAQQLGDEEGRPLVGADVVEGDDVGVIERAGQPGLALEALEHLRVRARAAPRPSSPRPRGASRVSRAR